MSKKIDTRMILWGAIGVLFVAALVLTFRAGLGNVEAAQTITDISRSVASPGMVGGC